MSVREIVRRTAIWLLVAASLVLGSWIAVAGEPAALMQNTGIIVVGAAILTSSPRNRMAALMLVGGVLSIPNQILVVPGFAEAIPVEAEVLLGVVGAISSLTLALAVLLFPTGRLTTRAGRVIAFVLAVITVLAVMATAMDPRPLFESGRVNPWGAPWAGAMIPVTGDALGVTDLLWLAGMLTAVAALIELTARWRRSAGSESLQFRWFAFGIVVVLACTGVGIAAGFAAWSLILYNLSINAIAITVWVAVTRHGLFEINRVVSRTAAYATVSILAVGVYALVVTSVTWLLPDAPSIAVAAATLAAAALALPALRTIRRVLDRRFDRERYDARRVVEDFGTRLRTEIDPERTAVDLLAAADSTLQPRAAGVWLARSPAARRAAVP